LPRSVRAALSRATTRTVYLDWICRSWTNLCRRMRFTWMCGLSCGVVSQGKRCLSDTWSWGQKTGQGAGAENGTGTLSGRQSARQAVRRGGGDDLCAGRGEGIDEHERLGFARELHTAEDFAHAPGLAVPAGLKDLARRLLVQPARPGRANEPHRQPVPPRRHHDFEDGVMSA